MSVLAAPSLEVNSFHESTSRRSPLEGHPQPKPDRLQHLIGDDDSARRQRVGSGFDEGPASVGQGVDPTLEVACLAVEDGGVAEGVGEERGALDAGEERECEVACIWPAEFTELTL